MNLTLPPAGQTIKNGRGAIGTIISPATMVGVDILLALLLIRFEGLEASSLYSNTMLSTLLSTLSNFEIFHFLIHSGTGTNILYGLFAMVCYGLFSKFYEPLTRSTESPLVTASLLYGGAAILLFIATIITAIICYVLLGWHFNLPTSVTVFGSNVTIIWVVIVLLLLILGMSLLYFAHIVTEAFARRGINMGVYTILFQINVLVIAITDWAIYRTPFSTYMIVGGLLIFVSSTIALIAHHFAPKDGTIAIKLDRIVISLGVISAVACGLALYIDGEIGRNYIFKGPFNTDALAPFLFYEMLTFGIPFFWTYLILCFSKAPLWIKYKNDNNLQSLSFVSRLKKVPLHVFYQLREEFKRNPKKYFLSSLFSAGQFVFSVLALSLPGPRFYAAAALAISPVFSILLDRNKSHWIIKMFEYGCGIISATGLFLLIMVNR